jgi:uncharacterized integral membrane protein
MITYIKISLFLFLGFIFSVIIYNGVHPEWRAPMSVRIVGAVIAGNLLIVWLLCMIALLWKTWRDEKMVKEINKIKTKYKQMMTQSDTNWDTLIGLKDAETKEINKIKNKYGTIQS